MNDVDKQYLDIVKNILAFGEKIPTRARIDNKNVSALTTFDERMQIYFNEGFPILTTKFVSFKNIATELLWFLKGSDNIQYLKDNNVNIWNQWTDEYGNVGKGSYPVLWRSFPFGEDNYIDQISYLIDEINQAKLDPTSSCNRRLLMVGWHPQYSRYNAKLPACHGIVTQFHILKNNLYCTTYQRSADTLLGLPYNLSSYSLLLCIIAHLTNLNPYRLTYNIGNCHIYENHIDQLREQLGRSPYKLPHLAITDREQSIDDFIREDFKLIDYKYHPSLRGEVAI